MFIKIFFRGLFIFNFSLALSQTIDSNALKSDIDLLEGAIKNDGFFTFFYKTSTNEIFLEIRELEKDFLYVNSLSSGVGNNDIGLDRGQLGQDRLVFFKKAGDKILLIQPNLKYRAVTENESEKRSVKEAFVRSVLYGFDIEKEIEGKYYGCKRRKSIATWVKPEKQESGVVIRGDREDPFMVVPLE